MTTWRLVLVIIGLSFVGFGAAFIAYPGDMASLVSLALINATARTDVRATYGGLEFGVGVFFLACALRRDFVRVGLFAAACVLVAMATARTVGLVLDGFWQPLELLIAVIEFAGGFVATWGALVARPAGSIAPPVPTAQASEIPHTKPSSPRS
jgi:Domain of unknown function (DUF4345)